jgi:Holliday junction resolvase-like predicted endonuclease
MNLSNKIGKDGENLAKLWYLGQDYQLVAENFQYFRSGVRGQNGEIDLIFAKGNRLYLVEVKSRGAGVGFGHPLDQITRPKLVFLYKTYQAFLSKYPQFRQFFVQFDAAVVIDGQIKIYPNCVSFDGF